MWVLWLHGAKIPPSAHPAYQHMGVCVKGWGTTYLVQGMKKHMALVASAGVYVSIHT